MEEATIGGVTGRAGAGEYPVRSVVIEGVLGRASARAPIVAPPRRIGPIDVTPRYRAVRDAVEADKELGNPGDQHHCPLCLEYFGWEAFKSHAQQCINARAPRERVWVPPGTPGAIQSYGDTVGGG